MLMSAVSAEAKQNNLPPEYGQASDTGAFATAMTTFTLSAKVTA
jgi:hypothetical protein